MIGVEAIVSRRSMKERTAVGRRFDSRKSVRRTPVMLRVNAIEKNAIAAVIRSRGSAKRRMRPMIPGRCQAGSMGRMLSVVANLYSAVCPGPVCARILSSRPMGTSGSGERNSSHSRPRRDSSNRAVQAGQTAMWDEKVFSSSGRSSPSSASARRVSQWPQAGEFGMLPRSAMITSPLVYYVPGGVQVPHGPCLYGT